MSKCRYCGREYESSLWDDGFCCGRCRALAKKNNIVGKIPKGCLYIILISVGFFWIMGTFTPSTNKDTESSKTHIENAEHKTTKKKKKKRKIRKETTNEQMNLENEPHAKSSESLEETVIQDEEIQEIDPAVSEQDIDKSEQTTPEVPTDLF